MIPYFIILIVAIFLTIIANKFKKNDFGYKFFIFLNGLILVLFAGFRDSSVGTDTNSYVNHFTGEKRFFDNILFSNSSMEVGYKFLEWISHIISNNYWSLLTIVAIFIIIFQFKSIYALSVFPLVSIFALITFGYFTFSFNGMRQGIALAIYMYAIQYVIKGNLKKYIFWVLIAFLFHKTVIIMVPLYFILRIKFSFKLLILFILSTTFIIQFFDNILDLSLYISDKYIIYKDMKATGGVMLTIFYVFFSLFFITIRKLINPKLLKLYDVYLNMFILGTIVYVIVQVTGAYIEITRIGAYFLVSIIFIWPIILKGIVNDLKILIYSIFLISSLIFYIMYLMKIGDLTPYLINKTLFN